MIFGLLISIIKITEYFRFQIYKYKLYCRDILTFIISGISQPSFFFKELTLVVFVGKFFIHGDEI